MEYPTLITAGPRWLHRRRGDLKRPEEVTVHEAGHQFWYGLVGTNEFEDAWLDEGFNTFADRARDAAGLSGDLSRAAVFRRLRALGVRTSGCRAKRSGTGFRPTGRRQKAIRSSTPSYRFSPLAIRVHVKNTI